MDSFLFEKCILKNFNHQPTLDQESAINKLARFIFYNKKKAGLVIKGYAGTGKTTLISSLVKACEEKKMKIILLAPTGRAAKVMSNYSQKESSTIHRHIYNVRQKKEGYFFSLAKNKLKDTLFVVDEASMIPGKDISANSDMFASSLLSDLLTFIYSGKGCKAIFVGDHAQLPPVGWDTSPALDVQYLNEIREADFYQFELRQVVRQAEGSGILNEATNLRNNIENEYYNLSISTSLRDVEELNSYDVEDSLSSSFSESNLGEAVIICRSNKRANLYNKEIRIKMLCYEEQLCVGDLVMAVKNNYFWLGESSDSGFIANGDILKIKRVYNLQSKYGYSFADVEFTFNDESSVKVFTCKVNLGSLMIDGASLPGQALRNLFLEIERDNLYINNRKDRKLAVLNSPYYQALQIKFAYALTCHKAQGGQWSTVFLDQGYLPEQSINKELLRWMYTSFTRAVNQLYLLNFSSVFIKRE
ncbi:AAA family ATPase [Flavobacteriales bacterium]|nr:AAA family ATPase [Flavobacteriales bacterium]